MRADAGSPRSTRAPLCPARAPPRSARRWLFISETADMLGLCVPAGLEEFFRAAGWDLSPPNPDGWAITPESMAAAAVAAGQTILGPPLAAGDMMPAAYLDR
jgi:hypothetical protein